MQPLFITAADGSARFVLHHAPAAGAPQGLVVYLHPFAEEMNKSRRMAALQSRALAAAGIAVLQIDLLGCGDSAGNLADASWSAWLDDAALAARWLRQQHGGAAPLWLWGLRAGCLVAAEAAARIDEACHFLFWQPPAAGKPLLQQFLRLKMAAELQGGQSAGVTAALRAQLERGEAVEVAGYHLPAALALGLEQAQLTPPPAAARCVWLETSTREPAALLPASQAPIGRWQAAGYTLQAAAVPGPAFWQTQEIEEAPALLEATLRALTSQTASAASAPAAAVPAAA
jgi:exosortase A-associated hydrolase 2